MAIGTHFGSYLTSHRSGHRAYRVCGPEPSRRRVPRFVAQNQRQVTGCVPTDYERIHALSRSVLTANYAVVEATEEAQRPWCSAIHISMTRLFNSPLRSS